jgi:hypothetical protein
MVMSDSAAYADDRLERDVSEDTAGLQQPEPSLVDQLAATMRAELDIQRRHNQSANDRTLNELRAARQEMADLRAMAAANVEMQELVQELYDATMGEDVKEQRRLQRQIAKLERAQATTPPPASVVAQQPQPNDTDDRFVYEIAPDLEDYARLRGFTDDDLAADNWMERLFTAGAPREIEYTPQGIKAYKAGMKRAMDKVAQRVRADQRPRTAPPNPVTAGSGPKNYSTANVRDIPNDEFNNNFAAIAAAVVAKNRR